MCLTIPGKIESIKKGIATVSNGSRTAQVDLGLVFDAKVGDWILYATDRAVKQISAEDAKEIISLLEDHYHPVDVSKLPLRFKKIIFKVRSQKTDNRLQITDNSPHDLTRDEIEYLLNLKGKDNLETLFAEANSIRKEVIEDFVCIHGIIEFSNHCKNNCLYCGIRRDNANSKRYRMTEDEIVAAAKDAVENEGYKLIVLQSGEDEYYSDEMLIKIIKKIKSLLKVFIFISVGERSRSFYKKALEAGASGSLIRFETSNSELYRKLRPGHILDNRLQLIRYLQELGYYVATGSMVGLPGQTVGDIAEDLLTIQRLGAPMISAGPYVEAKNTPLQITNYKLQISNKFQNPNDKMTNDLITDNRQPTTDNLELMLKFIAIARFMMPEVKIPVTTALETLDPENGRHRGLLAGANALMFNLTPEKYSKNYSIYDNKYREREKVWQKYGLFQGEESYEMLSDRLMVDTLHTNN